MGRTTVLRSGIRRRHRRLLGGYLTDLFGRRRVLTFSILLYGVVGVPSGFSTSIEMLLVLRCCVFIGVSVEFVAAVGVACGTVSKIPRSASACIGYTQAFSSFGGLLVATFNGLADRTYAAATSRQSPDSGWQSQSPMRRGAIR